MIVKRALTVRIIIGSQEAQDAVAFKKLRTEKGTEPKVFGITNRLIMCYCSGIS